MKVKPLGHNVLIELVSIEKVSEGGIVLPEDHVKREQKGQDVGKVLAFGPLSFTDYIEGDDDDERAAKWGVKIGDTVLFKRYDGSMPELVEGHENHRLITSNCLIGVLDE